MKLPQTSISMRGSRMWLNFHFWVNLFCNCVSLFLQEMPMKPAQTSWRTVTFVGLVSVRCLLGNAASLRSCSLQFCFFFELQFRQMKTTRLIRIWSVEFKMYENIWFDHNLWQTSIRLFDDCENINLRLMFFLYSHEMVAHGCLIRAENYFVLHHNASVSAAQGSCCGLPHDCNKLWTTGLRK